MKKSVWSEQTTLNEFEKLDSDIKTDVLIIGGGICGILCAHILKEAGVSYVLAEGKRIASGITKNTTAKITSQHSLIYDSLIKQFGSEKALMYLRSNEEACKEYERLCQAINCDYEKKNAYTYSILDRSKIEAEVRAVNSLGFDAHFVTKPELPFDTAGAVCFDNQAQFNPLKFINNIVKDMNIYEKTYVQRIENGVAITPNGKIKAEKIIVATHFPFINSHGAYFLKLYQHRSYVAAYENAGEIDAMYVDEDKKGMSFRQYGNLLLAGGGGHRTGKKGGCWDEIDHEVKKHYPRAKLKYQWAAQDCMSLDGVPYIGEYSKNTPTIYVASGFNKWGFSSSMAAAKILCDMITGKRNEYAPVYSPQRSILKPQLFVNGFEATANLLNPSIKRCPHLGCTLKWNSAEKSWDCPCHGSRFEEDGKLIDNPAMKDAQITED